MHWDKVTVSIKKIQSFLKCTSLYYTTHEIVTEQNRCKHFHNIFITGCINIYPKHKRMETVLPLLIAHVSSVCRCDNIHSYNTVYPVHLWKFVIVWFITKFPQFMIVSVSFFSRFIYMFRGYGLWWFICVLLVSVWVIPTSSYSYNEMKKTQSIHCDSGTQTCNKEK